MHREKSSGQTHLSINSEYFINRRRIKEKNGHIFKCDSRTVLARKLFWHNSHVLRKQSRFLLLAGLFSHRWESSFILKQVAKRGYSAPRVFATAKEKLRIIPNKTHLNQPDKRESVKTKLLSQQAKSAMPKLPRWELRNTIFRLPLLPYINGLLFASLPHLIWYELNCHHNQHG